MKFTKKNSKSFVTQYNDIGIEVKDNYLTLVTTDLNITSKIHRERQSDPELYVRCILIQLEEHCSKVLGLDLRGNTKYNIHRYKYISMWAKSILV